MTQRNKYDKLNDSNNNLKDHKWYSCKRIISKKINEKYSTWSVYDHALGVTILLPQRDSPLLTERSIAF